LALLFTLLCIYLMSSESNRIGNLLLVPLEQRFQRADISQSDKLSGIIVLTGGDERLSEAGRLARGYPHLKVVISGAGDMPDTPAELGGGIEPGRVILETLSNNTYENAFYSFKLIKPKPGDRWLLVTGASHMPRAIGSFREVGFEVEPWPVYDVSSNNFFRTNTVALREWLGLFVYRLLARTNALFPGPI